MVAAVLLLISDFSYHLKNWHAAKAAVAVVYCFPAHLPLSPAGSATPTCVVNSYFTPISSSEDHYLSSRWRTPQPQYWFCPTVRTAATVDSLGHLRWRCCCSAGGLDPQPEELPPIPYWAVLIAAGVTPPQPCWISVSAPAGFVVPASILPLKELGADPGEIFNYKALRHCLAVLVLANRPFRIALTQGPLWFSDYGLYGMQYGAQQLFEGAIPDYLAQHPASLLLISPNWANATDRFLDFFTTPQQRQQMLMGNVEGYLFKRLPLQENDVFIMTAPEYDKAPASPKFSDLSVIMCSTIRTGARLHFVRLRQR
jgi:hypothetical protein